MQKITRHQRNALSTSIAIVVIIVIIVVIAAGVLALSPHGSTTSTTSSRSTSASISSASSSTTTTTSASASSTSVSTSSSSATSSATSSSQASSSYSGRLIASFGTSNTPLAASDVNVTYPVSVTGLGNLPSSVSLPAGTSNGVTITFTPSNVSLTSQTPVQAQISVANSTAPGAYTIQTVAIGGGGSFNVSLSVQVVNYLVATVPQFTPGNLTVPAGSTVTWIRLNGEIGEHGANGSQNIVFNNNMATSPQLLQWQSWSFTFNQTGSFPYESTYTSQTGEITVVSGS
jgi:plastocyanin